MKKLSNSLLLCLLLTSLPFAKLYAQGEAVIPSSNRSTASMEKNLLFYADKGFSVSQSGSASLHLPSLFDGGFLPAYSQWANPANPYVILIENLPDIHVQAGAWIAWTTPGIVLLRSLK